LINALEEIMHSVFRSFITLSLTVTLLACSDDSSDSSIEIEGWVGAQGFDNAQVVVNQVTEGGQVDIDTSGLYVGVRESTDSSSEFEATTLEYESTLLIARGQIADVDEDSDNLATTRACQVKLGCTVDGEDYAFGEYYSATSGFEWRSIIFNAEDGSRHNVNAITTLAAAFAYDYDVKSNDLVTIQYNAVFTPYDIVLANSQLSNILGLTEIVSDLPAKLTSLDSLKTSYAGAQNQIRYGALLGGLQQLELEYQALIVSATDSDFITQVAAEYAADEGQLYYRTQVESRALTLEALYTAAYDNLLAISETLIDDDVKQLVTLALTDLAEDRDSASSQTVDTKTAMLADDLALLLTDDEISDISLGLELTKLFVTSINEFQTNFWEDDYEEEIDAYQTLLEELSDEHRATLDVLVQDFVLIQDYYVSCNIGGRDCTEAKFDDVIALNPSYDSSTQTLTLDGDITVSQELENLSVTNTDTVTESQAVNILIVGTLERDGLVLKLDHTYDDDDDTEIEIPSTVRVYYPDEVTGVPETETTIEGYEIIWGDFQLYDESAIGTDEEMELSGAFLIFYRGVYDPQDLDNSDLRFNLSNWTLSSIISDTVSDEDDDDDTTGYDITTLIVSAAAYNPDTYYPSTDAEIKFANLEGFYTANDDVKLDTIAGLLTYSLGTEMVEYGSTYVEAETIDFSNSMGETIRYRFYPDNQVIDQYDVDDDDDTDELVTMHIIEECELVDGSESNIVCGAKSRIYEERDLQQTINDLWELGAFQETTVDGRGTYFIDFPTEEIDGCLNLQTLSGTNTLDGTLIEQEVLGLSSVSFTSQVSLMDDELDSLSDTLFDMTIVAPTKEQYTVNLGLSHNYTGTTTDDSGIILGTGSDTNVLSFSYDTSDEFTNSGSYGIFKGGVELVLEDGSEEDEDQEITAYFSQTYSGNVTYTISEDENGDADRCVLSVNDFDKDTIEDQVYHLNYGGLVYGTARLDTSSSIWEVTYIDGTTADMTWTMPSLPLIDVSGTSPVLDIED
jgi:hypothetical protein